MIESIFSQIIPQPIHCRKYSSNTKFISDQSENDWQIYSSEDQILSYLNFSPYSLAESHILKESLTNLKLHWLIIGNLTENMVLTQLNSLMKNEWPKSHDIIRNKDPNTNALSHFLAEGYLLLWNTQFVAILSNSSSGFFYGCQTYCQILKIGELKGLWSKKALQFPLSEPIEIIDYPRITIRAFHLDLKDLMPTYEYLCDLLRFLAYYKYNCVVLEYEDKFPFQENLTVLKHPFAWSESQFLQIKQLCASLFIEIIPLIQIFGHVEFILKKSDFRHLMETESGNPVELGSYNTWSLCPLHAESSKLVDQLIDQMINAHPDARFIHIGADEVYQLGTCPRCRDYVKSHSKSELYIQFINRAANRILAAGKRPIMWHDYLLLYPENLNKLDKRITIMYWIYDEHHDLNQQKQFPVKDHHKPGRWMPHFEFFQDLGFEVWGAPSLSANFDCLLPNYLSRLENVTKHAIRVAESNSLGVLITSWVVCANRQNFSLSIESMIKGLEYRILHRDVQGLIQKFVSDITEYSETTHHAANFPSIESLSQSLSEFTAIEDKYLSYIQATKYYYVSTKQILEGQLDSLLGWNKYHSLPEKVKKIQSLLQNLISGIDALFIELYKLNMWNE